MPKKFVFVVHALSPLHRKVMGLRFRRWSVAFGKADGSDPQDIRHICRFRYGHDFIGDVVGIPMPPTEFLADPEVALRRMIRAVHWSARDGIKPEAIGLGSLCSVVAGRGEALQAHFDVPVTTGHAGTTWCLYQNIMRRLQESRQNQVAVVGASSPVGTALTRMLSNNGVSVIVDSKKAARKTNANVVRSPEEAVAHAQIIAGTATTGPYLDPSGLQPGSHLYDISLPQSLSAKPLNNISVWTGETMSMPRSWDRGFWGPIYHLISGYGWNTVLACLLEPLMVLADSKHQPFAQGRFIHPDAVLRFGELATELGFCVKPSLVR